MTVTIEDLVRLSSMIGIPVILGVVWLVTALVKTQTVMSQMMQRMERMEMHMHELRNHITALLLEQARNKHNEE